MSPEVVFFKKKLTVESVLHQLLDLLGKKQTNYPLDRPFSPPESSSFHVWGLLQTTKSVLMSRRIPS